MTLAASTWDARWHDFWHGEIGQWIITKGLSIILLVAFAVVATRFINWAANRISARLQEGDRRDAIVRSETVKHRQAVAAVISSVAVAVLYIVVGIQIVGMLGLPVSSLVAPAAVLGAALGFGAQRIVQDLLSGFFVITEKQYGFGDLVQLTVSGLSADARGTVEDVTLRVTRLATAMAKSSPSRTARSSKPSTCPRIGPAPSWTSRFPSARTSTGSTMRCTRCPARRCAPIICPHCCSTLRR